MKTMICSLLARILFDHPDFNFLEYTGLNFDPVSNNTDNHIRRRRAVLEVES